LPGSIAFTEQAKSVLAAERGLDKKVIRVPMQSWVLPGIR